jgi:hypothetical protein
MSRLADIALRFTAVLPCSGTPGRLPAEAMVQSSLDLLRGRPLVATNGRLHLLLVRRRGLRARVVSPVNSRCRKAPR